MVAANLVNIFGLYKLLSFTLCVYVHMLSSVQFVLLKVSPG